MIIASATEQDDTAPGRHFHRVPCAAMLPAARSLKAMRIRIGPGIVRWVVPTIEGAFIMGRKRRSMPEPVLTHTRNHKYRAWILSDHEFKMLRVPLTAKRVDL